MKTKYCNHCKEVKPTLGFSHNKHRKNGLQDYCKECMTKLRYEWEKTNPPYRHTAEARYDQQKRRGSIRGVKICISRDDFVLWFNSQKKRCHYCNQPLVEYKTVSMQGLTLDRPDNSKPYEAGNIVLCCRRCNTMKGSWLTEEQMLDAARRYFPEEISD